MIAFSCSRCQHALTRHDNEAGTRTVCPACGHGLHVPRADGEREPRIRCICPRCHGVIKAKAHRAGTAAQCPRCRTGFVVPSAAPISAELVLSVSPESEPSKDECPIVMMEPTQAEAVPAPDEQAVPDLVREHLTRGSTIKKALVVTLGVLYVICPLDFIPDIFPVIGWLDDVGVVAAVVTYLRRSAAGL